MRRSRLVKVVERGGLKERRGTSQIQRKSLLVGKKQRRPVRLVSLTAAPDLPSEWLSTLLWASWRKRGSVFNNIDDSIICFYLNSYQFM